MSLVEQDGGSREVTASAAPEMADPLARMDQTARPRWGGAMFWGYATIIAFFVGFGGFAAFADLESSVMAPGELRVDRERRVVQHDSAGVVTEILVRDGDTVEEGQVLFRLDPTVDRAERESTRARLLRSEASLARFRAERDGAASIGFPDTLTEAAADDPKAAEILENERQVFASRMASLSGSINLRLEQIDQIREQIRGMELEREATREQLVFIEEELEGVKQLFEQGLERKPRVLALQRQQASLRGRVGRLTSEIARMRQQIGELELQAEQMERDFQAQIASGIEKASASLQELRTRMEVFERRVDRLEIRAPASGSVINLDINTEGAFVRPGQTLMEIVPRDDGLVVVARIKPKDVEHVKPISQVTKVQVRLTAFSQRFTHPIEGELLSVSDDTVNDGNGPDYYKAVVRIDEESKEHILPGIPLASGMPAIAMLNVGQTTLLNYLVEPLYLSVAMALREPTIE